MTARACVSKRKRMFSPTSTRLVRRKLYTTVDKMNITTSLRSMWPAQNDDDATDSRHTKAIAYKDTAPTQKFFNRSFCGRSGPYASGGRPKMLQQRRLT